MTTLEERLKEVAQTIVHLTGFGQALHVNDILPDLKELVRQELLALAEKVEKMKIPKPTCYCREYTLGAHDCGITSNEAVVDAAALIRSKADELYDHR